MSNNRYKWAAAGDINAFFGLMLDNIADLILTVSLLALVFQFPVEFALNYMIPGTAIGVLVGDTLFFFMALRLAKRTGRNDVTAMPLGLDTPSTFGMVFFVLGPAFLAAKSNPEITADAAALHTWHIGICAIVISGLFKFACAFGSGWIRKVIPRAGLLGVASGDCIGDHQLFAPAGHPALSRRRIGRNGSHFDRPGGQGSRTGKDPGSVRCIIGRWRHLLRHEGNRNDRSGTAAN